MKKYLGFLFGVVLACCAVTIYAGTESTGANASLNMGVEYHVKSTEAPIQSWIPIAKKIASVMQESVVIYEYQDHRPIVKYMSEGKITFGYVKKNLGDAASSKDSHVQLLAVAVTKDPITGKVGTTYDSELMVAKNSPIKTLSDLQNKTLAYYSAHSVSDYIDLKNKLAAQHIHVTWKRYPSIEAAFTAVANHQADAISAWDHLVDVDANKDNLKNILTTPGFRNPGLYVNTRYVTQAQRQQLLAALAHVKGPYHIIGFK